MEIKLLNIKDYAEYLGVSRQTVWRWVKGDSLDYFTLPGSKKKWFATEDILVKTPFLKTSSPLFANDI